MIDDRCGSLANLAPADLEVLAGLLEALVPGEWSGTPWATGWHDCCGAIRVVGRTLAAEDEADLQVAEARAAADSGRRYPLADIETESRPVADGEGLR